MFFDEIILESTSSDYKLCCRRMGNFIAHMLKFKYISNIQTRSWVISIKDRRNECKELLSKKSVYNKMKEIDAYYDIMNMTKMALKGNDLSLFDFNNEKILFDVDFMLDGNVVRQYLMQNVDKSADDYYTVMTYLENNKYWR